MKREKEIQNFIDDLATKMWGKSQSECIEQGICVCCHKRVDEFKDAVSQKEYYISGLCQECQDETF